MTGYALEENRNILVHLAQPSVPQRNAVEHGTPGVAERLCPLLIFLYLAASLASAQSAERVLSATRSGERDLVLKTTGNGRLSGRRASFRFYEAADGTRSVVWYGTFASNEQAESAIKQWIRPYKVTRRDRGTDSNGQVTGERVVGSVQDGKTGAMEYIVVRRDILTYWRIQSKSLADAMQLDASITAPSLVAP